MASASGEHTLHHPIVHLLGDTHNRVPSITDSTVVSGISHRAPKNHESGEQNFAKEIGKIINGQEIKTSDLESPKPGLIQSLMAVKYILETCDFSPEFKLSVQDVKSVLLKARYVSKLMSNKILDLGQGEMVGADIILAGNISSNHGFYQALVLNLTALKEWLEESARRRVGEIMQENPETPIGYHEIEFSMHEIVDGILADLEATQSELEELRLSDSDDY